MNCGAKSWLSAALIGMAFIVWADTGVWVNVSGGYWADSNNWENAYIPSGIGNAADFSALHSGETVTVTNYTAVGAVLFSGAPDADWTLAATGAGSIGFASSPFLQNGEAGEIRVEKGTMTFNMPFGWLADGIVKSGSGCLRLTAANEYAGNTRIDGGTIILAEGAELNRSTVVFNAVDALLSLESDAHIGGVASWVMSAIEIPFNGLKSAADYNNACMANGLWVGGVLLVGTAETTVFREAWGWTAETKKFSMPTDALFDLASVTKAVGTATALSICMDRGWVDPDVTFTNYLPGYRGTLKGLVTVRDLARHISGFDNSKPYSVEGQVTDKILEFSPVRPAGETYAYSCGNYILLGLIVENMSGMSLAEFCEENVWTPLAMLDTQWTPLVNPDQRRVVKPNFTSALGVVSDESARAAGRPVGNAGLFSTADDLAVFCQMILKGGVFKKKRILSEAAMQILNTRPDTRSPVAFGWRVDAAYTPSSLSASTLSHTGYTGQSVWIDPAQGRFVILLTNRTGSHSLAAQARIELAERILNVL